MSMATDRSEYKYLEIKMPVRVPTIQMILADDYLGLVILFQDGSIMCIYGDTFDTHRFHDLNHFIKVLGHDLKEGKYDPEIDRLIKEKDRTVKKVLLFNL